eukprot:scaffold21843_cov28-Cyclotella_meneghiniana.AAC.1
MHSTVKARRIWRGPRQWSITLVGAAHKSIDSTTVVAASNFWSRNAPPDGGGLYGSIHFSSNASISEKNQDETL